MLKSFMNKSKVVNTLKLAKQYALDCEYRKALEIYANETLFSKPLVEMDAEEAEHFLLCGHAFQQFYSQYHENLEGYVAQINKFNENQKQQVLPEKCEDPTTYLLKAITCYENCIKILCGFEFNSSESKQMVVLSFFKIFECKREAKQEWQGEALELVQFVADKKINVSKYEFGKVLKQLTLEALNKTENEAQSAEVEKW
ncbi:Hypothetical_protein [Hexamita inflata]|uniref:Hypothetical_protein n=1 Tax=Hexamita inflata TaxID=28002 RepID=A0AA86R816_9EUKA|nr:Hypothetical protein HINF_LOCUS55643 [Hexamita inflata]